MAVPDLQDAINHLQQKDVEAAIAALERKIEEIPAHLTAHVLLARAYEAKQEWSRALKFWENVHFLMPNSPVGQEGKQRVLRRLDGSADASSEAAAATSDTTPAPDPEPSDAPDRTEHEEADDTSKSAEADSDEPTTATEAVSELEELRRQAEEEARRGGARPELRETSEPTGTGDDSSDSPQDRVDQLDDEEDDLDRLIDELESARIEPRPDVDDVPPPDLENDVDDVVSETLARIYEAQNQFREAAQIYVKLASQEPDRARKHLEKAAEMREQAEAKSERNVE